MILSWGKCAIQFAVSTNGTPGSTWTDIDTPKEDTTKLTPTAGDKKTATEEGGGIVDAYYGRTTFQLEFDLFVKKGGPDRPFDDDDGIISGNYAFRVIPEDADCVGIQIDNSLVHVEESYAAADGILLHYVVDALKPASGQTVKHYTAGSTATTSVKSAEA